VTRRERARVLVVLPHEHFSRMYLSGPVAEAIRAEPSLQWSFATRDAEDARSIAELGESGGEWFPLQRPFRSARPSSPVDTVRWLIREARLAVGFYVHLSLVYRFNSRKRFRGFLNRLALSPEPKRLARQEGHPVDRWLGWPAPTSRAIERGLFRLYHSRFQRHADVERVFELLRPDLVVLGSVQTPFVTPYAFAARTRGVPILGMVGSWDQPTTKGPVVPGVSHYVAPSTWTAQQLIGHHEIDATRVDVIGWVQMDAHFDERFIQSRDELFDDLGIGTAERLIVFGAYTERLGRHEPPIVAFIARRIADGAFGDGVALVVRPHPADVDWKRRLGHLANPPTVIVQEAGHGPRGQLASLMRHADVVLASAGTLCLDALVHGTPAVGVAFTDDVSVPFYDRPERMFEMEHYASVAATGGVPLAHDRTDLEELIAEALHDPSRRATERDALRELHLAPLDGRAGARFVALARGLVP